MDGDGSARSRRDGDERAAWIAKGAAASRRRRKRRVAPTPPPPTPRRFDAARDDGDASAGRTRDERPQHQRALGRGDGGERRVREGVRGEGGEGASRRGVCAWNATREKRRNASLSRRVETLAPQSSAARRSESRRKWTCSARVSPRRTRANATPPTRRRKRPRRFVDDWTRRRRPRGVVARLVSGAGIQRAHGPLLSAAAVHDGFCSRNKARKAVDQLAANALVALRTRLDDSPCPPNMAPELSSKVETALGGQYRYQHQNSGCF